MLSQSIINISTILNYLIATLISLTAGIILFLFRQRWRADKLRSIFIADLEHTEPQPNIAQESKDVYLYDSVMRANAGKLGLLSNDERQSVIEAYAKLRRAREGIASGVVSENSANGKNFDLIDDADRAMEDAVTKLKQNQGLF
ncbi:hypothetical protein [Halorubrum sp. Ib24]|uniref:hypothetical protein n=1 Tax=Halorubrum sp. Ib24 TaxID=1383850 RepID=UPI00117B54EE|nr:hypothetical protein [Halorubrum sp. Ib24]